MLLDFAKNRPFPVLAAAALLLLFAGCAAESGEDHADHDHAEGDMDHAEEAADDGAPRVYFVGLENHDTCLEPGIVIPTADPWIHFGDGSDSIELELPLGEHYLCLQIGDGEHRTLDEPGLSQYIMVHVEDEAEEAAE